MALKYDVHTHAFHPKIAEKATHQLHDYYGIAPHGDGTLEGLLREIRAAKIDKAVVHCAATIPAQVPAANDWAIYLQKNVPEVEAFGTLHPDFTAWGAEFSRLAAAGIRGLKVHPDFQKIWLDDPRLLPMFEAAAGRFTLMVHVGDERAPEDNFSCPRKLAQIKKQIPNLTMIAAHLGGYRHWQVVVENLADVEVFIDTSSALAFIDDELLAQIRRAIPFDRWLFGSDYPISTPTRELELIDKRLKLSPRQIDELLTRAAVFFA